MGTRNLTMMVNNGQYVVAQYGQWDGYPEGQGITILKYLKKFKTDWLRNQLTFVKEYNLAALTKYVLQIGGTVDEAEKLWNGTNFDNSMSMIEKIIDNHPELSRDTGGEIVNIIGNLECDTYLQKDIKFAASTSCEWAYVIDFDKNTFEVFSGNYSKKRLTEDERFFFLYKDVSDGSPVRLLKSYDLDNLPEEEEFIDELLLLQKKK